MAFDLANSKKHFYKKYIGCVSHAIMFQRSCYVHSSAVQCQKEFRSLSNIVLFEFAGGIRCAKNVTIHNAAILSINAGEHWLGIGAADNSLSLFRRPQERLDSVRLKWATLLQNVESCVLYQSQWMQTCDSSKHLIWVMILIIRA